jgi:hypothetical protein
VRYEKPPKSIDLRGSKTVVNDMVQNSNQFLMDLRQVERFLRLYKTSFDLGIIDPE